MYEPLQHAPLINYVLHGMVFVTSLLALIVAGFILFMRRHEPKDSTRQYHWLIFIGLFFYTISEYSDLYTPGLMSSLGGHNYLTEQTLLVGLVFLFIAIHRLVQSLSSSDDNK